jgi:hypothetical protein
MEKRFAYKEDFDRFIHVPKTLFIAAAEHGILIGATPSKTPIRLDAFGKGIQKEIRQARNSKLLEHASHALKGQYDHLFKLSEGPTRDVPWRFSSVENLKAAVEQLAKLLHPDKMGIAFSLSQPWKVKSACTKCKLLYKFQAPKYPVTESEELSTLYKFPCCAEDEWECKRWFLGQICATEKENGEEENGRTEVRQEVVSGE